MSDVINYKGPDLIKLIDTYSVEPGELAMWWLGQSGFAVKSDKTIIYLDPYLSIRLELITENRPMNRHVRITESPLDPSRISNAEYIICSHNHGDHLDPDTVIPMLKVSDNTRIVVPPAAVNYLRDLGVQKERIVTVGVGDHACLNGFDITAIPGKHNEFDFDKNTGYPYVGYIINFNGIKVYHAGDTVFYEGLEERLKTFNIDIALLPINGGDRDRVNRGFMSNLQFWEAADLAANLNVKMVIPTHYDMFTINTENVERFEYYMNRKHPNIKYTIPKICELIKYSEKRRSAK